MEASPSDFDDRRQPDPGAGASGQYGSLHCGNNLPSQRMKLWDPLALRELSALLRDPVYRGRGLPHGDGRPVLLIPGFLSGDWSLRLLHDWLKRIGYTAHLSGIQLNVLHSEHMLAGLRNRLAEIRQQD